MVKEKLISSVSRQITNREILLLQPWIEDFYTTECRQYPLGLLFLAGQIKNIFPEFPVHIYDFQQGKRRTLPWPKQMDYLKRYYRPGSRSPFNLFSQYYRFGFSNEQIFQTLRGHRPMLIGISVLFTPYYRQSLSLARLCKEIFPDCPVVMGGGHASLFPQSLLKPTEYETDKKEKFIGCDYVITTKAEENLVKLIAVLLGHGSLAQIPQLVFCGQNNENKLVNKQPKRFSKPIIDYSIADHRLLKTGDYRYHGRSMAFLITSRGCPYRCSFCTIQNDSPYTMRPNSEILLEIEIAYKHGIVHFDIEDDNFTFDKSKCLDLLDQIRSRWPSLSLSAMNGVCYWLLDKDILTKMKQSNFDKIDISLVTINRHTCRQYNRPHNIRKFLYVLHWCFALRLPTISYIIVGLPGQSLTEMVKSIQFLSRHHCQLGISPYYDINASAINSEISSDDPYLLRRLSALCVHLNQAKRDSIFTLLRLARVINFVKQCLDIGNQNDNPWFNRALQILRQCRWEAEGKDLPFCPEVAYLWQQKLPVIRGQRSDAYIRLNG